MNPWFAAYDPDYTKDPTSGPYYVDPTYSEDAYWDDENKRWVIVKRSNAGQFEALVLSNQIPIGDNKIDLWDFYHNMLVTSFPNGAPDYISFEVGVVSVEGGIGRSYLDIGDGEKYLISQSSPTLVIQTLDRYFATWSSTFGRNGSVSIWLVDPTYEQDNEDPDNGEAFTFYIKPILNSPVTRNLTIHLDQNETDALNLILDGSPVDLSEVNTEELPEWLTLNTGSGILSLDRENMPDDLKGGTIVRAHLKADENQPSIVPAYMRRAIWANSPDNDPELRNFHFLTPPDDTQIIAWETLNRDYLSLSGLTETDFNYTLEFEEGLIVTVAITDYLGGDFAETVVSTNLNKNWFPPWYVDPHADVEGGLYLGLDNAFDSYRTYGLVKFTVEGQGPIWVGYTNSPPAYG
jgi:hypothetical protein